MNDFDVDATIVADGAFRVDKQRGGWGAWMCRRQGAHMTIGGPIDGMVSASHEVEIRAIANALREAIARDIVRRGDVVLLETDCNAVIAGAIMMVDGAIQSPADGGLTIARPRSLGPGLRNSIGLLHMRKMATDHQLSLRLRHRQRDSGWVSRRVDEIARRQLADMLRR